MFCSYSSENFTIGGRGSDNILETLLEQQLLPTTLHTQRINQITSPKSLERKGHLTSLQHLRMESCPSLEFLQLQHLTSLQRLYISWGDNLQFMPKEGLQPSLSLLQIYKCSGLEKRSENKMGKDWANISQIPCIQRNDPTSNWGPPPSLSLSHIPCIQCFTLNSQIKLRTAYHGELYICKVSLRGIPRAGFTIKPTFDIGDIAENSHSYFRPNWRAASSSLYCYQLEAFVDMLGSCSSECLTN
ncbi:unnamed protein product [Prunus armeniaca]